MKVIIGADAVRYPLTGIGRYAYELGLRMPNFQGIEDVRYFRTGKVERDLPERPTIGFTGQASLGLRRVLGKASALVSVYRKVHTYIQERSLRPYADYIYHGPNYYLPLHKGPCVATFHDLSVFKWAECHPAARVRHMQKELPIAIKRASVLLTDSEFTKQEISAFFNWPLERIVVAPLAASSSFRPMTPEEVNPVITKFSLRFNSYALFVGTLDPRKNIDLLLDLYERMPENLRNHMPLVVVGFEGWKSSHTIERLRIGMRAGWARYLGFLNELDLPTLYAGARVFVYPSLYEGFGLPVLEAMAAGLPVICSNAASLPEVTGGSGAAVLLAPDDADGFYDSLTRAFEDDRWCVQAGRCSVEQAKSFSWDKTVSATNKAYTLSTK